MKNIRPKLLPTLICLTVVGLVAATLPYPGFGNGVTVLQPTDSHPK